MLGPLILLAGCSTTPSNNDCGGCGEAAHCDPVVQQCYCDVGTWGDPQQGCIAHDDVCSEAEARVGHSVCRHSIDDDATWSVLSIGHGNDAAVRRAVKFLVPAVADARVPIVFGDTNWYRSHHCLLARGFEPQFPDLSYEGYRQLIFDRSTREYYGGTLSELSIQDAEAPDGPQFVFTVETLASEEDLLTQAQLHGVYRQLQDRLSIGSLSYTTDSDIHLEQAQSWTDPTFPVTVLPESSGPQYEAYTSGLAFGRVRRFTDAQLAEAGQAAYGWQDIVVLENAPVLLEGVMGASITEARQDVLTHLNVLSALRGTPNASIANALDVFAPHDGELVRLEVLPTYYSVRQATAAEAEAHWATLRPVAELGAVADFEFSTLQNLDEIAVADPQARTHAVSRFGSKVAGLATLRSVGDRAHIVEGFGIPMAAYLAFMSANSWEAPVASGTASLTYAQTIDTWLADGDFRSDAALRSARLRALREEIVERGVVDAQLLEQVRAQIGTAFGDTITMVRFRSSSNAEDSLSFNGAGLYDSVSGCGPDRPSDTMSACDATGAPRPIDLALKRVWASLWSFGAYEERDYYQLDHSQIGMGVLVNPRFADERANGVAFTGNPQDLQDRRYTINVQLGEVPVVSSTVGLVAELDRVVVEAGSVQRLDREIASSLLPDGAYVLDDARLTELAELLADIAAVYPIDATAPPDTTVMLDTEFKLTEEGTLVFKQIRPFAARPYAPGGGHCR